MQTATICLNKNPSAKERVMLIGFTAQIPANNIRNILISIGEHIVDAVENQSLKLTSGAALWGGLSWFLKARRHSWKH